MAGETTIAKQIIVDALKSAADETSQGQEPMLFAVLREALSELSQSRSRADIESYISFHLDNLKESEWVTTRGC